MASTLTGLRITEMVLLLLTSTAIALIRPFQLHGPDNVVCGHLYIYVFAVEENFEDIVLRLTC